MKNGDDPKLFSQLLGRDTDKTPEASDPILSATPEVTPQDLGKPSPVPYSVFINRPVPSEQRPGDSIVDIKIAVAYRTDAIAIAPHEVKAFIELAFQSFEAGYYRFELVVGDWSVRVYKHPNN